MLIEHERKQITVIMIGGKQSAANRFICVVLVGKMGGGGETSSYSIL